MRLLNLEIDNFRVFRHVSLMLPDKIIGIIGPNGAGKSSLVEAVAWALYGNQVARSAKEEIKSLLAAPNDPCQVVLDFEIRGQTYRVLRRLVGKTERAESEIWRDGVRQSIGSTESITFISSLLRLDWRGFLTSFLARQQELNSLSDLQPAKRREQLAAMLGVERVDDAIRRVRDDARLLAQKTELLGRQAVDREQLGAKVQGLREHVIRFRSARETNAGAYSVARSALEQVTVRHREHEDKRTRATAIDGRMSTLEATSLIVANQATTLTAELTALEQAETRLADLTAGLADYDNVRTQLEVLRDAKAKLDRRTDLERQLHADTAERGQHTAKSATVRKTVDSLRSQLDQMPVDISNRLADADHQLEISRQTYVELQAQLVSARRELTKVEKQIADISSFGKGTTCDRCHRPFGDELPEIKAHLETEAAQIRQIVANLAIKLSEAEIAGKALRQSADQIRADQTRRKEVELTLSLTSRELAEIDRQTSSAASRLKQTSEALAQLGDVTFDQPLFDRVAVRFKELENLRAQRDQLAGSLTRLPNVRTQLAATHANLESIRQELSTAQAERVAVGFDQTAFAKTSAEFNTASQAADLARDQLNRATLELESSERELAVYEKQLADLATVANDLETARTDQFYAEKLNTLFGDFRKVLIARIRPRLAELASGLIADMTAGRYNLIDLDENYDLRLLADSQYFGIERFSGGEKDLANLCLRLAISQALTESAGLDRSFVILDEVFGSQDEERKELILSGMGHLKRSFPQVLLITHIESIKDRVETLIEIQPTTSGWSEVRVVGQT